MNRRDLLLTSAAAAFSAESALAKAPRGNEGVGGEGARLNALFDAIMTQALDNSPEFTTSLGLDSGARAASKFKLDDRSIPAQEAAIAEHGRPGEL
jgi:uncharacterized protein (DUF885 family)